MLHEYMYILKRIRPDFSNKFLGNFHEDSIINVYEVSTKVKKNNNYKIKLFSGPKNTRKKYRNTCENMRPKRPYDKPRPQLSAPPQKVV